MVIQILCFLISLNQSGNLDNTFATTYLIPSDGSRLSVELVTFYGYVNIEVTLKGYY